MGILGLAACSNSETTPLQTITIIAPNGAPALSQVEIAHNAQAEDFTIDNYKVSFETTMVLKAFKQLLQPNPTI